jgi:diguanylate cyclase (GGDEF)-like protein
MWRTDTDESANTAAIGAAESAAASLSDRLRDLGNTGAIVGEDAVVRTFAAGDLDVDDSTAVEQSIADVSERLLSLQEIDSSAITSVSIIDSNNIERARVVAGDPATSDELGADLSGASFIEGTSSLRPGSVHWSEPYYSSHTGEPVVAVVVSLTGTDRESNGALKAEIVLTGLQPRDQGTSSMRFAIGDQVVTAGANATREELSGAEADAVASLSGGQRALSSGTMSVAGQTVAFARVDADAASGHVWWAMVDVPSGRVGWLGVLTILGSLLCALAVVLAVLLPARAGSQAPTNEQLEERDDSWEIDPAALEHHATRAVSTARRHQRHAALLVIDVDCLDDGIGAARAGSDSALVRDVLQRLERSVRLGDSAMYLGGHRFGVTLDETNGVVGALEAVERLDAEVFGQLWVIDDQALALQASIGIAMYPNDSSDVAELISHAEIAAAHAKSNGLAHCLYNRDLDPNRPERLALASDLQFAISLGELALHYQPKWSLSTGAIVGVESLVRWNHPVRGPLAPVDFLDVAESSGLLADLNRAVMSEAAAQLHRWRSAGKELDVAVNISASSFRDSAFLSDIVHILDRIETPPTGLVIEITEAALLTRPDQAIDVLHTLRELGLTISVTDFGTGFSSLRYLRQLPVAELKIDRGFVKRLAEHPVDQAIVRSAIGLGHSLGCMVTAEGVEDAKTLTMLREMGCDQAQGYLLGRPVPADQLAQVLATRKVEKRDAPPAEPPGTLRPEVLARLEALRRANDNPPT